jgi:iron complex outermembrane receptor protein
LHHGAASIEKGNINLIPERGWNSSVSLIQKSSRFHFEVTAYANYLNNFIYQQPGTQPQLTIKGAFPVFYYKQIDALISGADLDMKWSLGNKLSFSVKAMYLYGQDLNENQPLVLMPSNRLQPAINLSLKEVGVFKNPQLKLEGIYVSRQYRTPLGIDYKPAPPEYFLMNMSFNTEFGKRRTIAIIYAGVNNIMNTVYREYLDRFRYFCDAPGRNFYLKIQIPIQINKH